MLVLPVEPKSLEAPDRLDWQQHLPRATKGAAPLRSRRDARTWRRTRPNHSRESSRTSQSMVSISSQIAHYPTLQSLPAAEAVNVIAEVESYKSALRKCYESFGARFVSFEVGRLSGKGSHAHIQVRIFLRRLPVTEPCLPGLPYPGASCRPSGSDLQGGRRERRLRI
jgi:hypothetical protein